MYSLGFSSFRLQGPEAPVHFEVNKALDLLLHGSHAVSSIHVSPLLWALSQLSLENLKLYT